MVWRSTNSDWFISHNMHPVSHVMGDIDTLGWAVLKNHVYADQELYSFVKNINWCKQDFYVNYSKWVNIQPNKKTCNFKCWGQGMNC